MHSSVSNLRKKNFTFYIKVYNQKLLHVWRKSKNDYSTAWNKKKDVISHGLIDNEQIARTTFGSTENNVVDKE